MPIKIDSLLARRAVAFAFLVFIFGLTFWVLPPFLVSLAWAGILAYVTWPLHQWLCRRLPGGASLAGKGAMIAALERLNSLHPHPLPDKMAAFGIAGGGAHGLKRLQTVQSATPSAEIHEYTKGGERITLKITQQPKGAVSARIETPFNE